VQIVALSGDLMDRSRLTSAFAQVAFGTDADACAGADVVIVDLARFAALVAELRRRLPSARIVAYGAHVDDGALAAALDAGADAAVPRSRFFRDPAAAIAASG